MPQISAREFERVPLRVHAFLAGVLLHDVWAVDLPRTRPGITLDEFLRTGGACPYRLSPIVRALLSIRLCIGQLLGCDRKPAATASETFATHLTATDRSKSLTAAGTRQGLFRVVYRFENEQLLEVNRTAHAAALSTLVETANTARFYFAVYVCNVSRFTPVYMALIDPFRKLIVYPSLLRSVCASWNKAFGTAELTLVWRHIAALPSQPVSQFGKRLLAGLAKLPNDFGNKTRNKLGTKPKTARWSKISKNQWRNGLVILGKPVSS